MVCSNVGSEIWILLIGSAGALYLLTVGARPLQRWLRSHRSRSLAVGVLPAFLLDEARLWPIRTLAVIPGVMLFAALLGLVCFFGGQG